MIGISTTIMQQLNLFFLHLQGEVLGITRFGLAKMKESVLMLASVSNAIKNFKYCLVLL